MAGSALQKVIMIVGVLIIGGCGSGGSNTTTHSSGVTLIPPVTSISTPVPGDGNVGIRLINATNHEIEFCLVQDGTQVQFPLGIVNASTTREFSLALNVGMLHRLFYALPESGTNACSGTQYGQFTAQDNQSYTFEIPLQFPGVVQWDSEFTTRWEW